MITTEEKNLGRRFALGALTLLLANFLIQVFVLGPDASGYNETWGPIIGISSALQLMAGMGVVRLSGKLLDDKDKPLLTGSIGLAYTVSAVGVVTALVPSAVYNAFNETSLTADMAADFVFYVTPAVFLFIAPWNIQFAKYGKDILPSWGPAVGNTVGYGIGIVTIVFLAGLFPDAAFIPLTVILGVVLTPAWFFAISKAYAS